MPEALPISLPSGISIAKTRHIGPVDVSFDVAAQPGSDVLAALLANARFPLRPIAVNEISVGATGSRDVPFDGGKGTVTFSGQASGYQRLAVVDEPAEITALLVRDRIQDDLARGLALERRPDHRYVVLRWGYDLQGAAKGAMGLGFGASATFGAQGKRLGAYAVIRQLPSDLGAASALQAVFESWMLPTQFAQLDDLAEGTWIVAEIDGSFALTLGAQYGYDFNWVRESVQLGGLSGDIGLKVQAAVAASFGFEASGQYAIALGRPLGSRRLRLQLFRLDRRGMNLAFSARASAQGSFGGLLPDHFDEFVAGVIGVHGLQILEELDTWTSPDRKLSDLLAGVGVDYAEAFLGKVTGIDPKTAFEAARQRLVGLLQAWHDLPHKVSSTVYSAVQHEFAGLPILKAQLSKLASQDLAAFQPDLERQLADVNFFRTPFGKWLESAALTSVLNAVTDTTEYARVQQIARKTLVILDGSQLESTLVKLQQEIEQRIGLRKIEQIVDQTSFDQADEWLKARLGAFLGSAVDFAKVEQLRTTIHRLLALRETFFAKAHEALTRNYEFQLLATYQRSTTDTALIDVAFDFAAAGASPDQLVRLAASAIGGDFEHVLVQGGPGIALKQAVLTHGIKRQTHLEVTMPFGKTELDHINDSLAKVEAIDSDRGRILIYDLHADDLITARGRFSSRFAVNAQFTRGTSVRVFDEASMSHAYTFRQAVRGMRRVALEAQLGAYASSYFPNTFGAGEASLQTWVSDLDRTLDAVLKNGSDNFGNTLLQLDVSAPAALVGGWALAPAAEKAEAYFEMSKAIQKQLRMLIPLVHFANLDEFRTLPAAAALLVYAALPLATGIVVDSGRIVQFDDKRDVYWDITPANIKAMADHSLTLVHLLDALRRIHETLVHADGFADLASRYDPARPDRIIAAALNDTVGAADLNNLLGVERSVIREAQAAGRRIAGFMQAKNSSEARQQLAAFGAKVTEAFNSQIGGLFSSRQLRPLGTLVFLEAARAFDPSLKAAQPSAMLELTVLREQPSFDMRSFVDGVEAPVADVVRAERFVSLS